MSGDTHPVRSLRTVRLRGAVYYLTNRRMQLAGGKLRDTDAKVLNVALDVGDESEAAFSRSFKGIVGVAPGTWRRERRQRAGRAVRQKAASR